MQIHVLKWHFAVKFESVFKVDIQFNLQLQWNGNWNHYNYACVCCLINVELWFQVAIHSILKVDIRSTVVYSQLTMVGKNQGVCHSWRQKGYFFLLCLEKNFCPQYQHAFVKCFELDKESMNKGRLFNTGNAKYRYWEQVGDGETSGESSAISIISNNHMKNEGAKDLSAMFESRY